jgi:hypothetical protein
MIVYLLAISIESIFLFFIRVLRAVILGFGININWGSLVSNDGFRLGVFLVDKFIGWAFLINALTITITIISVVKLIRLVVGIISKGA